MQKTLEKIVRLSAILGMLLAVFPAAGEERNTATVSGKVLSTDHETMDFATVQIKGTAHGTRPDEKGIYHLHVEAGIHTLVFKAMGLANARKSMSRCAPATSSWPK